MLLSSFSLKTRGMIGVSDWWNFGGKRWEYTNPITFKEKITFQPLLIPLSPGMV